MKKLNVAIIGQGRSGRDIHGNYLLSELNTHFNVKYVVEADKTRRDIAKEEYKDCIVFEDYTALFDVDDVDLVVNASYSHMHYPITKDLLAHGKNVLVEKPFARNRYECDDLIKTAKESGAVLSVFQQSMVAPYYLKVKELLAQNLIGNVLQVNIRYNGFSRRWDWQTLQSKMGGNVYNTGPHPLGLAMDFLDFSEETRVAYSKLASSEMFSGDAENFAKIILTAPGKPVVDVEINSTDPYTDYNMKIIGERGTIKASLGKYSCKYITPGENPDQPVKEEFIYEGENKKPVYCKENLISHEISEEIKGSVFSEAVHAVYESMYSAITEGGELLIKPELFARLYGVIAQIHDQNPLERKF